MNLIEQLGGYDEAKKKYTERPFELAWSDIGDALLEYRREHNIFEAGDWIVNTKTGAFGDFIKYTDTKMGHKHCFVDIGLCDAALFCVKNIRHATPAEIEAGKRLN